MEDQRPYTTISAFDDIDDSEIVGSPSLHAPTDHEGVSNNAALFHVVCVIAGTGILQLPSALNQSGWIGILIMIAAAFVNEYTGRLLIQCLYVNGRRLSGYPEIGYVAFGRIGRGVVNVFYNSVLLGVTCLYLILAGMDLTAMVGLLSKRQWIVVCAIAIWIPFLLMRTLKEVAIVSLFGAIASVGLVIIIIILGIADYPSHVGEVEHQIIRLDSLPIAMGAIAFSFGGNFVYPEVEHSMRHPDQFPGVLKRAMGVITVMYLMSAVVGYMTYGNTVMSPILENLPAGTAIVTIHVLLACPVLVTTFSLDMERSLKLDSPIDTREQFLSRAALRTLTIIIVTLVAMAVPYFSDFMTLIGSISNTLLIFIFPVLFHYKLFGWSHVSKRENAARILILIVGTLAGLIGGSEALAALYTDFTQDP